MAVFPVFLPGGFYGQKSLAGYSVGGCKELDMTEHLTHTRTHIYICIYMYTHMYNKQVCLKSGTFQIK